MIRYRTGLLQFRAKDKKQQIIARLDAAIPQLYLDAERMERFINNLIGNAIKFSPIGADITVSTALTKHALEIRVQDQGIGIPEAMQTAVFTMFTNAARKGTEGESSYGLGLSICKQIVEQHGGSIGLQSEEGKGTTFYIHIPMALA